MVEPIRHQHSGDVQKGRNAPLSHHDVEELHKIESQIDTLIEIQSLTKAQMKRLLKSSPSVADALRDSDSIMKGYITAVTQMIQLLGANKIPVGFLTDELNSLTTGTPPYPSNFGTQMGQIFHQTFSIMQVLPASQQSTITSQMEKNFATLSDQAQDVVTGLQKEIANLDIPKTFQELIDVQNYLQNYSSDPHSTSTFEKFISDIQDLEKVYENSAPSDAIHNLIGNVFTALDTVTDGKMTLADEVGTYLFFESFIGGCDDEGEMTDAEANYYMPNHINIDTGNIPFMEDVQASMKAMLPNFLNNPVLEGVWVRVGSGGMMQGVALRDNWQSILVGEFSFPGDSTSKAAGLCSSDMNNYESQPGVSPAIQQYGELAQALSSAQAIATSLISAAKGDFKDAFPQGPYPQGAYAPSGLNNALEQMATTLMQIYYSRLAGKPNDPRQTLWNQLLAIVSGGPPYPQNMEAQLMLFAKSMEPLQKGEKSAFKTDAKNLETQINTLQHNNALLQAEQQLNKSIAQSMGALENLINKIKKSGVDSLTSSDWLNSAQAIKELMTQYDKTTDPNIKQGIQAMLNTMGDASNLGGTFANFLFYTQLSTFAGKSLADAEAGMKSFISGIPTDPNNFGFIGQLSSDMGLFTASPVGGDMFSVSGGNISMQSDYLTNLVATANQNLGDSANKFCTDADTAYQGFQVQIQAIDNTITANGNNLAVMQQMEKDLSQLGS
ncbi:MAG: hypothetical protein H7A36_07420 [Chlamydiales bacterium]|nr:hypothetical protein [Chlamydiales bacterium]